MTKSVILPTGTPDKNIDLANSRVNISNLPNYSLNQSKQSAYGSRIHYTQLVGVQF